MRSSLQQSCPCKNWYKVVCVVCVVKWSLCVCGCIFSCVLLMPKLSMTVSQTTPTYKPT
jgi:hypothetical protein